MAVYRRFDFNPWPFLAKRTVSLSRLISYTTIWIDKVVVDFTKAAVQ